MNQFTYLEAIHLSNAGTADGLAVPLPGHYSRVHVLKNRTAPTVCLK